MDADRPPIWLDTAARATLRASTADALTVLGLPPVTECHLRDVLTELDVVRARDQVWPSANARVRRVTGYAADVLPIRLSEDELIAILTTADLDTDVTTALTGGQPIP
jgi:hypothetical protein